MELKVERKGVNIKLAGVGTCNEKGRKRETINDKGQRRQEDNKKRYDKCILNTG